MAATSWRICCGRATTRCAPSTSSPPTSGSKSFPRRTTDPSTCARKTTATAPWRAPIRSTTSPPTWAGWASSSTTRPSACSACASTCIPNAFGTARDMDVGRYFYSSSACVYNAEKQDTPDVEPLSEEDAYPTLAEDGYGWEKLFSERMCRHFREDFDLTTRVARYHNVYGPFGTYDGGREKAPAALTRKAIAAKLSGSGDIVIWGDGTQTRSFMYIDDCVRGTQKIMHSGITDPINLGSDELVTIGGLVDVIEQAVEVDLDREYDLTKPQGVDGRNSDNTKILNELGWEPPTALRDGMEVTAEWIEEQMRTHREAETTSRFAVAH
nr:NAD-dependent epimerase/dehydratase family protein [Salinibacter ruber]